MHMFDAHLWMFPSHLLPHQPTHIHPERGGASRRHPFVDSFMDGCVRAGEAADAMETSINMDETCACMQITRNSCGYLANTYENIPPNGFVYFHIPSYTFIYIKIFNIWNMRTNMEPTNGHNSAPRAFPKVRIWHKAS